jgi:hypothetical protein
MKATDQPSKTTDSVIDEVHRHKDAIAREYGNDIGAYLEALRKRQKDDRRVLKATKGEQSAPPNP